MNLTCLSWFSWHCVRPEDRVHLRGKNSESLFIFLSFCLLFLLEPPVPASYYWYFLALQKNQVYGIPPLLINGQASLLNMGFQIVNKTWLSTTISAQDCLLNPDICLKGFTIGIKIRLDLSVKSCKQPRYIIDTGPSVKSQGVSLYVMGGMFVANVTSSKGTWQVC